MAHDDAGRDFRIDTMSEGQIHEFRDAFNQFDRDNSGYIDASELKLLCEFVGQEASDEDVAQMMALADGDQSGSIDFWEFATLMAQKMGEGAKPDQVLKAAFSTFDANGDGSISADEIKEIMREMGENISEDDIQRVLGSIDANGDGFIDYNEFTQVVTKEMREGGFSLL